MKQRLTKAEKKWAERPENAHDLLRAVMAATGILELGGFRHYAKNGSGYSVAFEETRLLCRGLVADCREWARVAIEEADRFERIFRPREKTP